MKIIKLTSSNDKKPIYINLDMIGHFYDVEETQSNGIVKAPKHTRVGVVTHRNGGFEVVEDSNQIIKLIQEARLKF